MQKKAEVLAEMTKEKICMMFVLDEHKNYNSNIILFKNVTKHAISLR